MVQTAVEDKGRELTAEEVEKIENEVVEAVKAYPDHHPITALANYRNGREVWDTNGDMR